MGGGRKDPAYFQRRSNILIDGGRGIYIEGLKPRLICFNRARAGNKSIVRLLNPILSGNRIIIPVRARLLNIRIFHRRIA